MSVSINSVIGLDSRIEKPVSLGQDTHSGGCRKMRGQHDRVGICQLFQQGAASEPRLVRITVEIAAPVGLLDLHRMMDHVPGQDRARAAIIEFNDQIARCMSRRRTQTNTR